MHHHRLIKLHHLIFACQAYWLMIINVAMPIIPRYCIQHCSDFSRTYSRHWTRNIHPISLPVGRYMECLSWIFCKKKKTSYHGDTTLYLDRSKYVSYTTNEFHNILIAPQKPRYVVHLRQWHVNAVSKMREIGEGPTRKLLLDMDTYAYIELMYSLQTDRVGNCV